MSACNRLVCPTRLGMSAYNRLVCDPRAIGGRLDPPCVTHALSMAAQDVDAANPRAIGYGNHITELNNTIT